MTLAEYYELAEETLSNLHKDLSALYANFAIDLQKAKKNHKSTKVLKIKLRNDIAKSRTDCNNQLEMHRRKVW